MGYQVVYLTGPPAAGKSTLSKALKAEISPLAVFEYGSRLTEFLASRSDGLTQTQLRAQSATIVTPEDIVAVDCLLLDFVGLERTRSHVIIDSHAVTKERYGFRVTPVKLEDFARLAPTQIWVLYATPEETIRRIAADPKGRPAISPWEGAFHLELQASVALMYGMHTGVPVHLINTEAPVEALVADLQKRFK